MTNSFCIFLRRRNHKIRYVAMCVGDVLYRGFYSIEIAAKTIFFLVEIEFALYKLAWKHDNAKYSLFKMSNRESRAQTTHSLRPKTRLVSRFKAAGEIERLIHHHHHRYRQLTLIQSSIQHYLFAVPLLTRRYLAEACVIVRLILS